MRKGCAQGYPQILQDDGNDGDDDENDDDCYYNCYSTAPAPRPENSQNQFYTGFSAKGTGKGAQEAPSNFDQSPIPFASVAAWAPNLALLWHRASQAESAFEEGNLGKLGFQPYASTRNVQKGAQRLKGWSRLKGPRARDTWLRGSCAHH